MSKVERTAIYPSLTYIQFSGNLIQRTLNKIDKRNSTDASSSTANVWQHDVMFPAFRPLQTEHNTCDMRSCARIRFSTMPCARKTANQRWLKRERWTFARQTCLPHHLQTADWSRSRKGVARRKSGTRCKQSQLKSNL